MNTKALLRRMKELEDTIGVSGESEWRLFFFTELAHKNEISFHDDMMYFVYGTRPISSSEEKYTAFVLRRIPNKPITMEVLATKCSDGHICWRQTVHLNVAMVCISYKFRMLVCTLQRDDDRYIYTVKKEIDTNVFPCLTSRRMDRKDNQNTLTYPNLTFHIEDYEKVLIDLSLNNNELFLAELIAEPAPHYTYHPPDDQPDNNNINNNYNDSKEEAIYTRMNEMLLFDGQVEYNVFYKTLIKALKRKTKEKSLHNSTRYIEFIPMKGPAGRGLAQISIAMYLSKINKQNSSSWLKSAFRYKELDFVIDELNNNKYEINMAMTSLELNINNIIPDILKKIQVVHNIE